MNHLVLELGQHKCHCGQTASRLMRCAACKQVIARCGGHGDRIGSETEDHCKQKKLSQGAVTTAPPEV